MKLIKYVPARFINYADEEIVKSINNGRAYFDDLSYCKDLTEVMNNYFYSNGTVRGQAGRNDAVLAT